MSTPDRDAVDLQARLTSLERRQSFVRPLVALTVALMLTTLAAFTRQAPGVVQAERLELVDASARPQAILAADTAGVLLTLLDKNGRATASLRLNPDPRLAVRDASGREVAGLGAPRARHLAQ